MLGTFGLPIYTTEKKFNEFNNDMKGKTAMKKVVASTKKLIALLPILACVLSAHAQFVAFAYNKGASSGGAPTQVESFNIALPNTANGTATATFGTSTVTGELIVAAATSPDGSQSLSSCTDSSSGSYTQIFLVNGSLAYGNGWLQLYYRKNVPSGITSVTCTETLGAGRMFVAHVKNLSNNGTLDQSAGPAYNVQSAEYFSGGTITGSSTQTCNVGTFNGGGSGATATVALTGTNTIAAGTAFTMTAAGSGYTSIPTTAVLTSGTATCSGTINLDGLGVGGPSTPWNSSPVTTTVANEYLVGILLGLYNGANCAPSASGSWSLDQHSNNIAGVGATGAFLHQIVSSTQTNIETTGTDTERADTSL